MESLSETELKAIVIDNMESWSSLTTDKLTMIWLSGMSNRVYRVTADGDVNPWNVILRVFGCDLNDKTQENTIFQTLSD